jgi:hypothetical protein
VHYYGYADPSGGRHDRFAVAVAHREDDLCVLDAIRAWTPPFNPSDVIAEAAAFLRPYNVATVHGDRYAAEFVTAAVAAEGLTYVPADKDRSALFLELLPLVNSGSVLLLDHSELLRELRGLERRRGATRDRVDHRPGSYDDRAVAAAGALVMAVRKPGMGEAEVIDLLSSGNDYHVDDYRPRF